MSSSVRLLSGRKAAGPALLLLLSAFGVAADPPSRPAEAGQGDSAVQPAGADTPARPGLKLPPDSIIVITEEAKEALRLVPRGFIIPPEKYQELIDEIARLKAQPKAEKPATPTVCRLTGRVEGDLARLQAEFEFKTDHRHAQVALGCGQGHPTAVTLDGQLPVLPPAADRYVLQVEEPGSHKAILQLDVAVASRGTGGSSRGFVLDLPRAAVTTVELDLPAAVKKVRVGRTTMATEPSDDKRHSRLKTGGLGPIEQLDLTWEGPAVRPQGPPLLTADGHITVTVEGAVIRTVAEITLDVLRGQATQWQLQVPPQAVLRIKTQGAEERPAATIEPANPKGTLQTVRPNPPSADPPTVIVELEQPRPSRADERVPVGPFYVVGAFRQRGTILIGGQPDARLRFNPRPEVSPRELSADDSRRDFKAAAAFTYWNLPAPDKPAIQLPLLTLEFETVKGVIEAEADHTLTLSERGWHAASRFTITPPLRGDVRELVIELPPDYELKDGRRPGEPVQEVRVDAATREASITLADRQLRPFTLTLEGTYPPLADGVQESSLELPRLKMDPVLDRGGKATVILPADRELVPPAALLRAPLREGSPQRQTWPFERMPGRLDVAWRPYRPDLPVDAVVDVTLSGTQARVQHRLWSPAPQSLPRQFPLRVPEALADTLQVVERGKPAPGGWKGPQRLIETDAVSRASPLVLEYFFPLPPAAEDEGEPARTFSIPLVVPEQATRGDIRVRVWSEPGSLPVPFGGPWELQPIEAVEGRSQLPDLCLRGTRPDLPLSLRLSESGTAPQATVLVERALIRATVVQAGQHSYRASFRLSQLRAPYLDIELPAAPAGLDLKVYLDGRDLKWSLVADSGAGADAGRLARLKVSPELLARPAVLDVSYRITPNQPASRSSGYVLGNIPLQTMLHAPLLRGSGGHIPVRWDVRLPADWVPLYAGSGFQFEQRWGWRGWLLAPQPAASRADLERWFAGDAAGQPLPSTASGAPSSNGGGPGGLPSVVCWRTSLAPLRLSHGPQQAWLLACSLGLLALGLGLYFLLFQRGLYGPVVVLLGAAAAVVGLLWPSVLAVVVYGCQPGLAVLLVVLGFHWLLQRRYRRQVVFLPGFTRVKGGSSLIRSGVRQRARGEPSTVDAPLAASSSQRGTGGSVAEGNAGPHDEGGGQERAP